MDPVLPLRRSSSFVSHLSLPGLTTDRDTEDVGEGPGHRGLLEVRTSNS